MSNNPSEVLPCPFCGKAPVQSNRYFSHGGDSYKVFSVKCENKECNARPEVSVYGPGGYKAPNGWLKTADTDESARDESQLRWNTRF